jgi:uncharacterized protein YbjT (DUF2867 family)
VKVLVVGATGRLGKPIVRQLCSAGHEVRVLSRSGDKARHAFGRDIDIVVGDVRSRVAGITRSCDSVVVSLSAERAVNAHIVEYEGTMRVLADAKNNSVERFVYISGASCIRQDASFPSTAAKLASERAIAESGVPYTILRPAWVNESLPEFVRGSRATVIGRQPNPFNWVAGDDLGRMVAKAITTPDAAGGVYPIFGPEALTIREALEVYCSIVLPGAKVGTMPIWAARIMSLFVPPLRNVIPLMAYFNRTPEEGDPTKANALLGAPSITVKQWAERLTERSERT